MLKNTLVVLLILSVFFMGCGPSIEDAEKTMLMYINKLYPDAKEVYIICGTRVGRSIQCQSRITLENDENISLILMCDKQVCTSPL